MTGIHREALIESGASRLSCKLIQFKAQTARNSKAIAKACNAEMDDFTPQDAVSRFDQSFPYLSNQNSIMAVRWDGGACRVAGKKHRGLVACEFAGAINLASI